MFIFKLELITNINNNDINFNRECNKVLLKRILFNQIILNIQK